MIIKNIALAGQAGTGKTTLLEALLYQGGCVERMGSVAAGTTVSDAAPEEIKRHSSVYTGHRAASCWTVRRSTCWTHRACLILPAAWCRVSLRRTA